MNKVIVIVIIICIFFITTGANYTYEANDDFTLEQSLLFDQLNRRWKKSRVGWAVGCHMGSKGYILRTEDGGENWVSQVDEDGLPMCVQGLSAVNRNTAWVVGNTNDGYGTILRTRNRGKKWKRLGSVNEIPNFNLLAVSAVSPTTAWVAGEEGVILKTKNGGATWEQQAVDITPKIYFIDLYAFDKNYVWAVGGDLDTNTAYILHTSDGGKTWTKQGEDVIPASDEFVLGVYAVTRDIVWAVGRNGLIMKSTNGGQNWELKLPPNTFFDCNQVVAINDQIAWVTRDESFISYTVNGGDTWESQEVSGGGSVQFIEGITAFDENELWVIGYAKEGTIHHTIDGGKNWLKQKNPVDTSLWRISFADALR